MATKTQKYVPIPESSITEWMQQRTPDQKKKIEKLTRMATRQMGYSQCREGGPVWQKAERQMVENFIRHEVDIDEIILEDKEK